MINGKTIRVKIWDTAGQEQFKSLTRNFFRNSDGIILVYDVCNAESFEAIDTWIESIIDNTDREKKMVLLGNKVDLEHREISKEDGEKMAQKYGIKYFETSAKEDVNISTAIRSIIEDVVKDTSYKTENIVLHEKEQKAEMEKAKCKC